MARATALALRLTLCGAFVCRVRGQQLASQAGLQAWQVAAVRVDAGPLDQAPLQAAANLTFVRAERNRFWVGCRQLLPVGFNSFTLIEQAAEVNTRRACSI